MECLTCGYVFKIKEAIITEELGCQCPKCKSALIYFNEDDGENLQ